MVAFVSASTISAPINTPRGIGMYFSATSIPVSTVRTKKMTMYSFLLCPPLIVSSDQIDEGEDQDPHQVDEVPEQPGDLDVVRARVRPVGVLAHRGLDRDHRQVGHAREHVEPVKAGRDEEGRPH